MGGGKEGKGLHGRTGRTPEVLEVLLPQREMEERVAGCGHLDFSENVDAVLGPVEVIA